MSRQQPGMVGDQATSKGRNTPAADEEGEEGFEVTAKRKRKNRFIKG